MDRKRGRAILIAAFVLSIVLHAALAGYFRWPFQPVPDEEPYARVRIIKIARVPLRTPAPTPRPSPQPTPHSLPSIRPPVITSRTGPSHRTQPGPIPRATARARATPAPTPAGLPTPALGPCGGHANAQPTVAATPDVPDIPPAARASKATGIAGIRVTLDARANVTGASVAQSSGSPGLDAVAEEMARGATYTPRYVNCKPAPGEYTFTVHFWTW